jgi:hypothetical protein
MLRRQRQVREYRALQARHLAHEREIMTMLDATGAPPSTESVRRSLSRVNSFQNE